MTGHERWAAHTMRTGSRALMSSFSDTRDLAIRGSMHYKVTRILQLCRSRMIGGADQSSCEPPRVSFAPSRPLGDEHHAQIPSLWFGLMNRFRRRHPSLRRCRRWKHGFSFFSAHVSSPCSPGIPSLRAVLTVDQQSPAERASR